MIHQFARRACVSFALGALALGIAQAAVSSDQMLAGFQSPPNSARPRVWWHWMNGNITKAGIQADLEWMHQTGIGGFQAFDAALNTPQVVEKRLVFMTPEWKNAFRFAIETADRYGLEAAIAGSPGWSESGGPWVDPQAAMKKVVWSETMLEGGVPYSGRLVKPPANSGPFLDLPYYDVLAPEGQKEYSLYADTRVIAVRLPSAEQVPLASKARISTSAGKIEASLLSDGALNTAILLPIPPMGQSSWIRFDFDSPQTVRAVTYATSDRAVMEQFFGSPPAPEIQFSDDGQSWRKIVQMPTEGASRHTMSFEPITARQFRAYWPKPQSTPSAAAEEFVATLEAAGIKLPKPSPDRHIAELRLESGARVMRGEEKAGFGLLPTFDDLATPAASSDAVVSEDGVIDVTDHMQADGSFAWTPPAGRWVVLRMGWSPLGITNHPASPEGTGLEVDKLSAGHVRDYMGHYLDLYQDASGGLMGEKGLQYIVNDSYEAGPANWTEDLLAQFRARRGYDATPWLPVLTGRVVNSSAKSDQFLYDYRQTLSELMAENHYAVITQMLHERGMGHYGESHESGRAFIGDGMEAKKSNDVPMSAMWTQSPGVNNDAPSYNADVRESASVAHIYGQNLVAAESLTAGTGAYRWSPATLKPTADKELAMGLNRFVIHTSVHQPLMDKGPGLSLGAVGQWFTRNETWAGAGAKAWVDYLSRSSFMLQQGRFVADIAWFYGEDSNITALYGQAAPPIPEGYPFDFVNADVIRHMLQVRDGQLVTSGGARYRVLAMDARAARMSLPVLKAVRDLVSEGAVVAGPRPTSSASLADDDAQYQAIVREVWGQDAVHAYGKGRVYVGMDLTAVLEREHAAPDFEYTKPTAETQVLAVHRQLTDGEVYFVDNRSEHAEQVDVSLRTIGRVPELWHAETGRIEPVSWRNEGGRTIVPLALGPWEAVFVVLRTPSQSSGEYLPARSTEVVATLDGSWHVEFQPGRGAPTSAELKLGSWSEDAVEGIRYFAGTGTYRRILNAPSKWLGKGAHLWLALGEMHELAEVRVNGRSLGVTWRPPYRIDIAAALHSGANTLEIAVTDLWANRLIHDARPDAQGAFTFTVPKFFKGDEALSPAGLIGPVRLERQANPVR